MDKNVKSEEIQLTFYSTPFASLYLRIQTLSVPIAIAILYFIPQFFNIVIAEKMSFYGEDGHCIDVMPLFGRHCFGDFGFPIEMVRYGKDIWGPPFFNAYPPLNSIIFLFFSFLITQVGATITVLVYLTLLFLCIVLPIWHSSKQFTTYHKLSFLGIAVIATSPLLNVIDRGNNSAWLIPLIYVFARNLHNPKGLTLISAIVVAISIKPQALILIVALLMLKEYRVILKVLITTALFNIIAFLIWDRATFFTNIKNLISSTQSYGSSIPGNWPPNVSMGRGILNLLEILKIDLTSSEIQLIVYLTAVMFILKLVISSKISAKQATPMIIPLIFLLPAMTWSYYLALLFASLAIHLSFNHSLIEVGFGRRILGIAYLTGFTISMTPIFFRFGLDQLNQLQIIVPSVWFIIYLFFIIIPWREINHEK